MAEPEQKTLFAGGATPGEPEIPTGERVVRAQSVTVTYEAPLPPPEHLMYYNRILPTAAERIMTMAEKAQRQQHFHINMLTVFAFLIVTGFLGVAVVLVLKGQTLYGLGAFAAELAALVAVYLSRREGVSRQSKRTNR